MIDKNIAIHQFTAGSSYGDAVTNSTFLIQKLLKKKGISGNIYAGHVAPELYNRIQPHFLLKPKSKDIILIHHAIGHGLDQWLIDLPGEKIIVYHNITPAKFFPEGSSVREDIKLGHEQLLKFRKAGITKAISISNYNKIDLEKAGFEDIVTIPLLIDLEKTQLKPWNKELVAEESKVRTILFVGRISPNKCQHELLEVAKYLRNYMHAPFQMIIVGNYREDDPYYLQLINKFEEYDLKDWVQITGKIPEQDLYGWYRTAQCFLCLSEHEGFGVPVVEAMSFGVPVLGFDAANVPYLLQDAGIIIREKNFPAIAALIRLILENPELRNKIITAQKNKITDLNSRDLSEKLFSFLKPI